MEESERMAGVAMKGDARSMLSWPKMVRQSTKEARGRRVTSEDEK